MLVEVEDEPQESSAAGTSSVDAASKFPIVAFFSVVVATAVLQAAWFALDNRLPSTDEAGHILNAMQYTELLRHFHPWKTSWLHQFYTVNAFYPPAVYIYDGFLKLLLGAGRTADKVCLISYAAVLTGGTFGITWLTTRNVRKAIATAALMFLYPQIQRLSHCYMLDLPLTAMVIAGLWSLLWWNENQTWKRTAVAAVVVSLACFTKQLGAFYLAPACLFLLWTSSWSGRKKLCAIGVAVAATILPWLAINASWIKGYAAENAVHMHGMQTPPWIAFPDYLLGLIYSMSFPLAVAFFAGMFLTSRQQHKKLALVYISAIGGLLLTSCLTVTFGLDRYAAPVLLATAIVTVCGASRVRFAVLAVLCLAAVQAASFSFGVPSHFPVTPLREFRNAQVKASRPASDLSWKQAWVVETIASENPKQRVWLNILPSDGNFNPHSFELLAAERHLDLMPTTSRRWTIVGDTVEFSPQSALWYQWYLLKSGAQGNQFKNAESASNYAQLTNFVKTSGKFVRVGTTGLPDRSQLELWRQK